MDPCSVRVLSDSEPPSSPQVVEDGAEEDEEELSGGEEADFRSSSGRGSLLTRRGITLRVLLKDGLVEPGNGVLTIHYLVTTQPQHNVDVCVCVCVRHFLCSPLHPQGKNFVGDLLTDGKIRWVETGQIFNSPSAWATHCKRLVNPAKKSGCGWASVRYRGQKLAQYKTTWLHKYQPSADMVRADSPVHPFCPVMVVRSTCERQNPANPGNPGKALWSKNRIMRAGLAVFSHI